MIIFLRKVRVVTLEKVIYKHIFFDVLSLSPPKTSLQKEGRKKPKWFLWRSRSGSQPQWWSAERAKYGSILTKAMTSPWPIRVCVSSSSCRFFCIRICWLKLVDKYGSLIRWIVFEFELGFTVFVSAIEACLMRMVEEIDVVCISSFDSLNGVEFELGFTVLFFDFMSHGLWLLGIQTCYSTLLMMMVVEEEYVMYYCSLICWMILNLSLDSLYCSLISWAGVCESWWYKHALEQCWLRW